MGKHTGLLALDLAISYQRWRLRCACRSLLRHGRQSRQQLRQLLFWSGAAGKPHWAPHVHLLVLRYSREPVSEDRDCRPAFEYCTYRLPLFRQDTLETHAQHGALMKAAVMRAASEPAGNEEKARPPRRRKWIIAAVILLGIAAFVPIRLDRLKKRLEASITASLGRREAGTEA